MTALEKRLAVNAFVAALKGDNLGMRGRVAEITDAAALREIALAARDLADATGVLWLYEASRE